MDVNKKHTQEFNGIIWKIYADEISHKIVVETRNSDERMADFFVYDLNSLNLLSIKAGFNEPWWVGIEDVYDGNVYYHFYNNLEFSNHLGIISYNIISEKIIWERKDLQFYKLTCDGVIGIRKNKFGDVFVKLNIETGDITEELTDILNYQKDFENLLFKRNKFIFNPIIFVSEEDNFKTISSFIQKRFNVYPSHSLEYLEYKNYIIISFYVFDCGKYKNELLVISLEGNIVLEEVISENSNGVGVGTFFVCNSKLIFVKFKIELQVYEL